jgi:hypothetical protein
VTGEQHADTVRRVLDWPIAYYNEEQEVEARAALDALLAEHQRLRDALERISRDTTTVVGDSRDYTVAPSRTALIAREALARDSEEKT